MQEKLNTATLFEDGSQVDFQAASKALISYEQLKAQEAVDQEMRLTQEVTPEVISVTPGDLLRQAGKNLARFRRERLEEAQNQFDLAA